MRVGSKIIDGKIYVNIDGSVDSSTSVLLHEEFYKLNVEEANDVEIDVAKMHYVSSAGLREFLILQKRFNKGKISIVNASSIVYDIFKITGFINILDVKKETIKNDYSIYSFKDFLAQKVKNHKDEEILNDTLFSWSFNDLNIISDIIAEDLINLGAKKGSHIAICGANSLNWIATFFAIQKIGAMAILVNPLLKATEIASLSHIGDIDIICTGIGPWLKDNPESFLKELINPEISSIKAIYDITKPIDINNKKSSIIVKNFIDSIEVRNDDPCVMIFTSGSTGVPKGVLLSSYNLLTAAKVGTEVMGVYENDVMCLVLPMFHIFGLAASLLAALMNDIKIVIAARIKSDLIIELVDKYKCTLLNSVPTLLMGIASSPTYSKEAISHLRFVGVGGAPVSESQMLYLQNQFPNASFCIVYGLSEMSPVSFTRRGDSLEHITKTVGLPIELINVKIQNVETKEECQKGEVGEILIKGEFLMSGYYKTPIEKQDFDNEGWFHTGDLGFLDDENYIHFAGRKKELIIRGGENIFPGEIQEVCLKYKGVLNAQIIGIPDDYFGEVVGCALMLKDKNDFNEDDFKEFLKKQLASHKIPSFIYTYDQFPMLANGKVDVLSLKKDLISKVK